MKDGSAACGLGCYPDTATSAISWYNGSFNGALTASGGDCGGTCSFAVRGRLSGAGDALVLFWTGDSPSAPHGILAAGAP